MDAAESHPLMPHLRLDDLLAELQAGCRRCSTRGTGRTRCWRPSSRWAASWSSRPCSGGSCEAAVDLVDARYGALGVVGEGGRLAEFIPVGLG